MKSLFTGEELFRLRRIDEGLERLPLTEGERIEAEVRDTAIERARTSRAGQGLLTLTQGWFERARAGRFPTTEEAAHACHVSTKLMWNLECGSVTAPELAQRIGRTMGLTRAQVEALTCARTAVRRSEEARARREEAGAGTRGA
jgi:hypothetical protein